jgi:C4-type Zn-finger protein
MADAQILPCPCCGAEARLDVQNVTTGHGSVDPAYQVICTGCGLRTDRVVAVMDINPSAKGEALVAKWNRRVGNANG